MRVKEAYGVIGMLDRCRDPRAPAPDGVALPGVAPLLGDDDLVEFAPSSFRNCSLFMVAVPRWFLGLGGSRKHAK